MLGFCFLEAITGGSWGLDMALTWGAVFTTYNQTNKLTKLEEYPHCDSFFFFF